MPFIVMRFSFSNMAKTHTRPPRLSESDGGQVYALWLGAFVATWKFISILR
jgi:hypothetical protein